MIIGYTVTSERGGYYVELKTPIKTKDRKWWRDLFRSREALIQGHQVDIKLWIRE